MGFVNFNFVVILLLAGGISAATNIIVGPLGELRMMMPSRINGGKAKPSISPGQTGFETIKICHDEKGALRKVQAGKFILDLAQAKLASFHSSDNEVSYDLSNRRIQMQGISLGRHKTLSLQLTTTGLVLSTRDTSVAIVSLTLHKDTAISVLVGDLFVLVDYSFGRPYRIFFDLGEKSLSVLLRKPGDRYAWDFIIKSNLQKSELTYVEFDRETPLIDIRDEAEKVGVVLYSFKNRNRYKKVMGISLPGNRWSEAGEEYTLLYNRKGKRKKSKTKFNLSCE